MGEGRGSGNLRHTTLLRILVAFQWFAPQLNVTLHVANLSRQILGGALRYCIRNQASDVLHIRIQNARLLGSTTLWREHAWVKRL